MLLQALCFLLATVQLIRAIPIDNGVEGEPEIECGATAITISFNTRNPFEGNVYVKGFYNQTGCRNNQHSGRVASINLPFSTCNVQRTRSLNPRGIFVRSTLIISFHPLFETKVDRAYTVQCFYMEADKTVSQELEVSMLTTGFQTQVVPMPVCRYDILDQTANGPPVRFAIVGQQVYHKWTCDSEAVDTFCMRVYSCFVNDGTDDQVTLIDEAGCAQDRYLLRNLEYLTDLMAGQETHVFKYADRAQLFFKCQIAITIKEPNTPCPRPACPAETGSAIRGIAGGQGNATAGLRRFFKRAAPARTEELGVVDVTAELSSLDMESSRDKASLDMQSNLFGQLSTMSQPYAADQVCLSSIGFGALISLVVLLFTGALLAVALTCFRSRAKL